jgi:hypothetical protein
VDGGRARPTGQPVERKRAFGEADRTVSGAVALAVGKPARATLIAARKVKGAL